MFYSVTCKNADCGKRFKIRGPIKAGIHKVGCPFCSHKMSVRIPAAPLEETKSQPRQAEYGTASPEQIRKKYQPMLDALQASYAKKLAVLKETYENQRAAIEAEMQAALNAAKPKQAAAMQDFSAAPVKDLGMNLETGKEGLKVHCPHCGMEIGLPMQDKAGKKQMKCPKCKGLIALTYVKPHIPTLNWSDMSAGMSGGLMQPQQMPRPSQPSAPRPMAMVERPYLIANHKDSGRQLRFVADEYGRPLGSTDHFSSPGSTEKVYLKIGSNTIGRFDTTYPSDIGIDGRCDNRMSRCSTCIEVTQTPYGFKFACVLRNSTNPVLCNGQMMVPNTPYPIAYGTDIVMGETRFTLMYELSRKQYAII